MMTARSVPLLARVTGLRERLPAGELPPAGGRVPAAKRPPARSWAREAVILAALVAAGIAVTWPRASYLTGRLPLSEDQSQYVWSFWWVARQVTHLGNPWFTDHLAAPVGVRLGYDTLMPLPGVVMTPVTLAFGPSASYNLLAIVTPGLAAYAMYRAARLWLPGLAGPVAAGALFGLSGMLASQDWLHLHTAMGCVFLPLTLAAAVRVRRAPSLRRGSMLGLVIGASVLADQEAAVLAGILAAAVLVPWLLRRPEAARLVAVAAGAATALAVASPQLLAMAQAAGRNGPIRPDTGNYVSFAAELPSLFAPSPRVASYGLTGPASVYQAHTSTELLATFGAVLTALAVLGLAVSWRRRSAWQLAGLWLGCAALALGPSLYLAGREYVPLAGTWHDMRVSLLMPFTWLIRVPGLSSFREADRLALLGLAGAALLAGAAVSWLRQRAWPLVILAAALAALEAGLPGISGLATAPTALPALDRPIAADHSGSVVVDVPFIVHGPARYGSHTSPYALTLATADGHPRAMSTTSAVQQRTITGIRSHQFYAGLVAAQQGREVSSARLAAARKDLAGLHVGWVLVWTGRWTAGGEPGTAPARNYRQIRRYLSATGFRPGYQADDVLVFRPARS